MAETFIYNEPSSSLNTHSSPQATQPTPIDLVEKLKENFAQNATKVDFYKDNTGLNWVAGYVGKAKDGAEWRLWTSYKPAADGSDAKYIATNLNEQQALDMFKSIVGRNHDEIVKAISTEIPEEEEDSNLKEEEEFVDEPEETVDSDLVKQDAFDTQEPKLKDLVEIQTWEKSVEKSKEVPDYLILKAVKGEVRPLIDWAGRVGIKKTTADLTGKPGIADPSRLANWLVEKAVKMGKPYTQQPGRQAGKGAGHIVTKEDLPDASSLDDSQLAQIHDSLETYLTTIEKESVKRFKTGAGAQTEAQPSKMPKMKTPGQKLKEAQEGTATESKTGGEISDWQTWAWKDPSGNVISTDPSTWNISSSELAREQKYRSQGMGPSGKTKLNDAWETKMWNAIRITNENGREDADAKRARQLFHMMAGKNYAKYVYRYGMEGVAKPEEVAKSMIAKADVGQPETEQPEEQVEQYLLDYGKTIPGESFEEAESKLWGASEEAAPTEAPQEAEATEAIAEAAPVEAAPAGKLCPKHQQEADAKKQAPAQQPKPEAKPQAKPAKPEEKKEPVKKEEKKPFGKSAKLADLKEKQMFESKEPQLATLRGAEIKTAPVLANLKVEKGCPVSKKQARLFGAVAGGVKTEAEGLTKEEAKTKLRGKKLKNLPEKKGKKK